MNNLTKAENFVRNVSMCAFKTAASQIEQLQFTDHWRLQNKVNFKQVNGIPSNNLVHCSYFEV